MRRQHWGKIHLIIIFVFLVSFTIFLINYKQITLATDQPTVPRLNIFLKDITLEEINAGSKETKYPGNTIELTENSHTQTFTNVELKGRGNSTWTQDKKPYQIKFSEKTDLFGMGKAKKWILLANYSDESHLRNNVAFYLEQLLQEDYALTGQYIDLYVDNEYVGLYYLTPKIEIGKSRIPLTSKQGVLVELENLHEFYETCYYSTSNSCIAIKDQVDIRNQQNAIRDFIKDYNKLELAAENADYDTVLSLIDIESFAKYYLLSEFTVNPDAYISSLFFYKDGPDDKIHVGPGWDYDLALSNRAWIYAKNDSFFSPFISQAMREYTIASESIDEKTGKIIVEKTQDNYSTLFYNLLRIPEFQSEIKHTYQKTLRGHKDTLMSYLRNQINAIRIAAIKDCEKWSCNFEAESHYLLDWISKRYDYFEDIYGNMNNLTIVQKEI